VPAHEMRADSVESTRPAAMGRLLSVNVGLPKDVSWQGRTVFTGVFKDPVTGPCQVGRLNVDGDGQGDLAGHGGEQRAVTGAVDQRRDRRHPGPRDAASAGAGAL
jgi:hypothetical protein